MVSYEQLTLRNTGYVSPELQAKIRATRLLVAGCGLGSVAAEVAARTGFERFVLVDGDEVAPHNLNRQIYSASDVGQPKVEALGRRLSAINPGAKVEKRFTWVNAENAAALVAECDLVLDTIDFLDLPAIITLHDAARSAGRPVISAFSVGWGALSMVFLPGGATLREICGLPAEGDVAGASYPLVFGRLLARLSDRMPADFVRVTERALREMADGKPCPAPQLAAGAVCTASLMVTQAVRVLAGLPVTASPDFVLIDAGRIASSGSTGI